MEDETQEINDETQYAEHKKLESWEVDTFGGYKWECVAITLSDYQELCESLKKTKDPNEKILRERLIEEVIPVIEAAEEKHRRKIERRERELMMMEKMVGAKRSSRLAGKQERERREAEEAEAKRKRQAELAAAHREQERQEQMERERQYRMMTREQRIKEREYKRLLKEEELARDALEQQRIEEGQIRGSGRYLKERIEKNKKELEELDAEEDWTFDCSGCGMHGKNFVSVPPFAYDLTRLTKKKDDGSHSVACERCNVWQHSKCLGISKSAAEKDNFHFVCDDCKRKEEDAKKPKISLKFKVGASSSPVQPSPTQATIQSPSGSRFVGVEISGNTAVRPPGQESTTNSHQLQSSPPSQSASSPSRPPPFQSNGVQPYAYPRPAFGAPQQANSGANHNGMSSSSSQQQPTTFQAGYPSYPPGNQILPQPHVPLQVATGYSGYASNTPSQHQHHSPGKNPPAAAESTPRQPSPIVTNGQSVTGGGRLPSPVINRPTMSPTQGNMDVGPVAGIPQKSEDVDRQGANGIASSVNGYQQAYANSGPSQPQSTPRAPNQAQTAQTPSTHPFSGLSPKKQRIPVPLGPPSVILQKRNTMSPSLTGLAQPTTLSGPGPAEKRTVSGTPILPPVENLRPSPEQMRNMSSNEPVPTPSKQPQAHPQPPPQSVAGTEN